MQEDDSRDIRDSIAQLECAFTNADRARRGAVSNAVFRRIITRSGGSGRQAEALMAQFADAALPHAVSYVHLLAHMRTLANATQPAREAAASESRRAWAQEGQATRTRRSDAASPHTSHVSCNASSLTTTTTTRTSGHGVPHRHCTLRSVFRCIDGRHTGRVTLREVCAALQGRGVPVSMWELAAVAEALSLTRSSNSKSDIEEEEEEDGAESVDDRDSHGGDGSEDDKRELDVTDFCLLVSRLRPHIIEHLRRVSLWQRAAPVAHTRADVGAIVRDEAAATAAAAQPRPPPPPSSLRQHSNTTISNDSNVSLSARHVPSSPSASHLEGNRRGNVKAQHEAELSFSPPPAVQVARSEASSNASARLNAVPQRSNGVRPFLTAASRGSSSSSSIRERGQQQSVNGKHITSDTASPSRLTHYVPDRVRMPREDAEPARVVPRHTQRTRYAMNEQQHQKEEEEEENTPPPPPPRRVSARVNVSAAGHEVRSPTVLPSDALRSASHTSASASSHDDTSASASLSPLTPSPAAEGEAAVLSQRIRAKLHGRTSQLLTTCMHLDPHHDGVLPTADFAAALRRVCPALTAAERAELTQWAQREADRASLGAATCAYVQLARDLIVHESLARRRSLSRSASLPSSSSPASQPSLPLPPRRGGEAARSPHSAASQQKTNDDEDEEDTMPPFVLPATRSARARLCRLVREELYSAVRDTHGSSSSNSDDDDGSEGDAVRAFLVQFDDTRTGYMDRASLAESLNELFLRGRGQAIRPWLLRRCMALARLPFVREAETSVGRAHGVQGDAMRDAPAAMSRAEAAARRRLHRVPRPLWKVLYDYRFLLEELEQRA